MRSTGEVMGIDADFATAFAKAQLGAGDALPETGTAFISVKDSDKDRILEAAQRLVTQGWSIVATGGTARFLTERGVPVERVNKVAEGRPHIVDRIKDGGIDLIFNTTEGWQSMRDSASIRAAALVGNVPAYTTAAAADAAALAIATTSVARLDVRPLQSYYPVLRT